MHKPTASSTYARTLVFDQHAHPGVFYGRSSVHGSRPPCGSDSACHWRSWLRLLDMVVDAPTLHPHDVFNLLFLRGICTPNKSVCISWPRPVRRPPSISVNVIDCGDTEHHNRTRQKLRQIKPSAHQTLTTESRSAETCALCLQCRVLRPNESQNVSF